MYKKKIMARKAKLAAKQKESESGKSAEAEESENAGNTSESTEAPVMKEIIQPTEISSNLSETALSTELDEKSKMCELAEITEPAKLAETAKSGETDLCEPACKRAKVVETVDDLINNIAKSQKPLRAILSDEFEQPIPFTKAYVGQVKYINELSKIIVTLNQKLPLKELSHLKRACRKEVLLFPTYYLVEQNHCSIQYYMEENVNELRDSFEYFKIIDVPAIAPKLKKQYVECGRSWSCNFHPDKYLEKLYNAELFSQVELRDHRIYMGMAFEVARFYLSQSKPNVEPSDILQADLNATVIVDPTYEAVVAIAFDNRANHPIQHSTMLAIDNVAKTQRGGVYLSSTDIYTEKLRGIGSMDLLLHLEKKYPRVKFGAREYITKSELEEMNLSASECPYLCTDYYVYVIREPCMMCSMALVHARANRVFFYKKHDMGVLSTKTKLHCVSSLNHHYEVFTDFV